MSATKIGKSENGRKNAPDMVSCIGSKKEENINTTSEYGGHT